MREGLYYKLSGKTTISGPPAGLVIGILGGVPLGFLYAYVMLYIRLIPYIRLLALFGPFVFGVVVGGITGAVMVWRKVRNAGVTKVISVLVGLASLYASWVFWTYAFFHRVDSRATLLPLIVEPHQLWAAIGKVNQVGTWQYGDLRPTGIILWAWWGIEALMIAGGAMVGGGLALSGEVFCEPCEAWCKKEEGACKVKAGERAEVKLRLESRDFGYVEKLGAADPSAAAWVRLDLRSCPTCRATNTLSANLIRVTIDKEGKITETASSLIRDLLVSSSEADTIRAMGRKQKAHGEAGRSPWLPPLNPDYS